MNGAARTGKGGTGTSSTSSSRSSNKGESHRIYWQQWPSSAAAKGTSGSTKLLLSRRDLITSSAAIRMSPDGARAQDVTQLLCETLNLKGKDLKSSNSNNNGGESWDKVQDAWEQDCLVLVGTLYSSPLHYVRFEHERLQQQQQQQANSESPHASEDASVAGSSSSSTKGGGPQHRPITISRSDPPFHVIKTLSSTDNPIQVRNTMIQHLEQLLQQSSATSSTNPGSSKRLTNSIAPKLQWYFIPGMHHPSSPIPSYIELDGYSTAMEDEDGEDNDDDDDTDGHDPNNNNDAGKDDENDQHDSSEHDFDPDDALHFPQQQERSSLPQEKELATTTNNNPKFLHRQTKKEAIFKKERNRYFELNLCQSSLQHDGVSGYLLKQSMKDPHVWKRVHCLLTDDHLWYISRIYTRLDDDEGDEDGDDDDNTTPDHDATTTEEKKDSKQQQRQLGYYSYAKHRRLGLTRALLLQPSSDRPTAPLSRTPFAFEVIASNGVAHRFRASTAEVFRRWINAVSSRIVQSYENSLFEHAELIVRDETEARHKRFMSLAVEPLWEALQQRSGGNDDQHNSNNSPCLHERHTTTDSPTMKVLRFGMEVTEYRERCRHIQAILPPKYPVLAMTNATFDNGVSDDGTVSSHSSLTSGGGGGALRIDAKTQAIIKSAWDEAIRLGSRATKVAVELQSFATTTSTTSGGSSTVSPKMPGSLEAICQHLEYVITGNFHRNHPHNKPQQQTTKGGGRTDNTRTYPPPMDMFDILLAELQSIAAAASARCHQQSPGTV